MDLQDKIQRFSCKFCFFAKCHWIIINLIPLCVRIIKLFHFSIFWVFLLFINYYHAFNSIFSMTIFETHCQMWIVINPISVKIGQIRGSNSRIKFEEQIRNWNSDLLQSMYYVFIVTKSILNTRISNYLDITISNEKKNC